MKAVMYHKFGSPDVLQVEHNVPMPRRQRGEVLVKQAATSVNPIDWKIRQGGYPLSSVLIKLPKVVGMDVAGVVTDCDRNSKFKVGDRVFGVCRSGTSAEYVSASEDHLVHLPPDVSFEEAAGTPWAALTAWQCLQRGFPLAGKLVLIHAGAGGVGGFAIQIAKALGAHVTTTCSSRNVDFVQDTLGADRAVDYTQEAFDEVALREGVRYDLIVDLIGNDYEERSLKLLKRSGHYVAVLNYNDWVTKHPPGWLTGQFNTLGALAWHVVGRKAAAFTGRAPHYSMVIVQPGAHQGLQQVAVLLAEGKVKVTIDRVLPLEKLAEAHVLMEGKHVRGKIVIKIADL